MTKLSLSDVEDVIAWFEGGDDENELKAASILRTQSIEIERLQRIVAQTLPYVQQHKPADSFDLEAQDAVIAEAEKALAESLPVEPSGQLPKQEA